LIGVEERMGDMVEFFEKWIGLITAVYKEYPFAAALATAAAVAAFVLYERRKPSRGNAEFAGRLFLALLAWAIIVPILGFVFKVLGWSIEHLEQVIKFTAAVISLIYDVYKHHPWLVLGLLVAAVAAYFIWEYFDKGRLDARLKAVVCVAAFCLAIAIAGPIADALMPSGAGAAQPPAAADKPQAAAPAKDQGKAAQALPATP
jgi:hypothetical protein